MKRRKTDKRLKMVISTSMTQTIATLGQGQITFYRQHGFDVDVFAAKGWGTDSIINEGAEYFEVNFVRDLSPIDDLITLWRLFRLLRQRKPEVIQLMTLKPCMLGALAGRIVKIPLIIRHKWGNMRDCNYKGLKKFLLFSADRLSNKLAHRVVVICHKLKESEVMAGAVDESKAVVYGSGSSNGLDLERFKKTDERIEKARQIRERLGIEQDATVLGTAMRINIEKGICELIEAFCKLSKVRSKLHLLIIGEYDIRDQPPQNIIQTIDEHPRIHFDGFVNNIEDYYAAMDVFVMPSYREGFCKSNIEASGIELPVVSTNIIGCSESVQDGVSGLLVGPRDSVALADAIKQVIEDRELSRRLGEGGRKRVEREFDQKLVWHNQLRDICSLLKAKGISPPVNPEEIKEKHCPLCS